MREQRVLLRAVEAVDLVEEQDRPLALLAEAAPGPLDDLAHVLHARGHRRQRLERLARRAGHEAGDRGLAGSGRAPEDHRREAVGLDQHPQRLPRAEQLPLTDDLVEVAGPQPGRQRGAPREAVLDRAREQVAAAGLRHGR